MLTVLASDAKPIITDIRLDSTGRVLVQVPFEADSYAILFRGDTVTAIATAVDLKAHASLSDLTQVELKDKSAPSELPFRFYRVEQVALSELRDTDADGIDDAYELAYQPALDPLNSADARGDFDFDQRTNLEEFRNNTHPLRSDPFRMPDAVEIKVPDQLVPVGIPIQLQVVERYSDGTTNDVTSWGMGTSYQLSNTNLARISPDGLLTPETTGHLSVAVFRARGFAVLNLNLLRLG